MRITGYGAGGFGGQQPQRDRAAAFRARHSIGQRVKGRILRREPNGLHWVLVGGEELLARLEVNANEGDELMFVVRALTPEIMLQALPPGVDAIDLPGLVQRFRAAREVFETQNASIFSLLRVLPAEGAKRRDALSDALRQHPEAGRQFDKIRDYLAQINAAIAAGGAANQAMYEPWATPGLRRQELLRRVLPGGVELALSGVDGAAGSMEARMTPGRLRLFAERGNTLPACLDDLLRLAAELDGRAPQTTGPMRLAPANLGGVLGELFADAGGWSSGGLNTRV
jgi:hypothetical protein